MGALAPSGARGLHAPPGAGRELAWAPVVGTSEVPTAEDCTPEDRTCERCTAQVCPPDCTSKDNTSDVRVCVCVLNVLWLTFGSRPVLS